ncbi:MAG: TIR domain-containing protein [Clostridia bacterium]|nr:TIR domain-containing protein [Clostridia bacterium]
MDIKIKSFIDELQIEFIKEQQKDWAAFQRDLEDRCISVYTFTLATPKYAEWRYSVKTYIKTNYADYDIEEILELLDIKELSETEKDRIVGLLTALASQNTPNCSMRRIDESGVFISHSSEDKEFVNKISTFFQTLGIKSDNIFCSSIEGQGVKNGERIEEKVRERLISSQLLFYIITKNFLKSNYCIQELGAGWILRDSRINGKKVFLLKLDDVKADEIKGFINSDFKYSELNQDSLTELIDDVSEVFNVPCRKAADNNRLCKLLLEQTKEFVETAVQQADMDDKEKNRILKEKLIKSIEKLTPLEKSIIAEIYFSDEKCIDLDLSSGVTIQLQEKLYIRRLTEVSTCGLEFAFGLQKWIADFIDDNQKFRSALRRIYNKQKSNPYDY